VILNATIQRKQKWSKFSRKCWRHCMFFCCNTWPFCLTTCFSLYQVLEWHLGRMSFVDFSQCADDHARILILVLPASGQTKPKKFNKGFDRIARLETVNVPGSSRSVHMRYRKYYAIENNTWGDFQVHRRALGLIVIGSCEQQNDIQELFSQYEQMKVRIVSFVMY